MVNLYEISIISTNIVQVCLVVTNDAVRIEDRSSGEALQTDFIKTVTFTAYMTRETGEHFAYVSVNTRLARMNCFILKIDTGCGKEISRAMSSALQKQQEEEKYASFCFSSRLPIMSQTFLFILFDETHILEKQRPQTRLLSRTRRVRLRRLRCLPVRFIGLT